MMLLLVAEPAGCLLYRGACLHVAFPPAVGVLMLLVDLFFSFGALLIVSPKGEAS